MPVTKVFSSPPQMPLHFTFSSPASTDKQLHPNNAFPHCFQHGLMWSQTWDLGQHYLGNVKLK